MCTPGIFSSWRRLPTTFFRARLVPIANSPARVPSGTLVSYSLKSRTTSGLPPVVIAMKFCMRSSCQPGFEDISVTLSGAIGYFRGVRR